jgi:cobalt/nickel transport system permease protein
VTPTTAIYLSWQEAAGGALAVALLLLVLLFGLYRLADKKRSGDGEPNWAVPTIDEHSAGSSFFHRWDPRLKLIGLLVFVFCIVSLRSLALALVALALALLAALTCGIPLRRAARRLVAMSGFLLMLLLVIPFTAAHRPGETLIYFPGLAGLPFHGGGFLLALAIVCKACAVALLMEPLFATAPLTVTLAACARLGVPESLGRMVLLCHRYIFVFLHEMGRMYRSMRVRGFSPASDLATATAIGNFLGMLFVRSFERTGRVYEAMLCRGYRGSFPLVGDFIASFADYAKALLWAMLGMTLLTLDLLHLAPW